MSEPSGTQKDLMGIKEVAELTGLPQATIRYYDQLHPCYPLYSPHCASYYKNINHLK